MIMMKLIIVSLTKRLQTIIIRYSYYAIVLIIINFDGHELLYLQKL